MPVPKGTRFGGRTKGTLNKRTVAALAEKAQEIGEIKRQGQKKATEVLNDLMQTSMSFAARYQGKILAATQGSKEPTAEDLANFWKAMECAGVFARALAPFQQPTFKAVAVTVNPGDMEPATRRISHDDNVVTIDDPVALARVYQRMVKGIT